MHVRATLRLSKLYHYHSPPPQVCSLLGQLPAQIKARMVPGPPLPTTSVLLHCDLVSCNHVRIDLPIVQ